MIKHICFRNQTKVQDKIHAKTFTLIMVNVVVMVDVVVIVALVPIYSGDGW